MQAQKDLVVIAAGRSAWSSLLRHRVGLGAGSLADDVIAAPRAAISGLRYPATAFTDAIDARSTVWRWRVASTEYLAG